MRISRTPLVPDEYEEETVQVGLSSVPGAGEGLFARWLYRVLESNLNLSESLLRREVSCPCSVATGSARATAGEG